MEFTLRDLDHSVRDIENTIGYKPVGMSHEEFNLVRKVGKSEYPRFHLLVKILNGGSRGHQFTLYIENSSRSDDVTHENGRIEEEVARVKNSLMKVSD